MEFWGAEVKAGEPLKVPVDNDFVVHLSQAALGESKKEKGSEAVVIYVEFDTKKYVLGTLSRESIPQISLDIVFEKEFALSHNWKNGSVHFCGYKANQGPQDESDDEFSDEDSLDEDFAVPLQPSMNGKADLKVKEAKPAAKSNAPQVGLPGKKVKIADQKEKDDDADSSEFDSDEDESGDSDEDMINAEDGTDDESDEDEDEEEKPQSKGKKRAIPVQHKTPVPAKKSKPSTPQNTDAKKSAHTATPHPAKKAGKAPASGDQTPKSGGQFSCKSCKKGFGSESGLEQHNKAKHSS